MNPAILQHKVPLFSILSHYLMAIFIVIGPAGWYSNSQYSHIWQVLRYSLGHSAYRCSC
jgi:hypothetical protein